MEESYQVSIEVKDSKGNRVFGFTESDVARSELVNQGDEYPELKAVVAHLQRSLSEI